MISWLSAIACVGGLEGTDEANSYSGAILFCVASFLLINQMERMKKGEQR
jgi:prenyltransferase beta subunit